MQLSEINVADAAAEWTAMGFSVVDGYVPIGPSFRFKLSGTEDGGPDHKGVLDYTFGDAGRSAPATFNVNGLKTSIAPLPDNAAHADVRHANSVTGLMKTVILASDTDATTEQLRANMPELGDPALSDTSDTGIRYNYWTHLEDSDFEIVSMKQEVAADTIAVVFLFVENLDAAIAAFGAQNVSEKSVYSQRDTVQVKPTSGITANLRLISNSLSVNG